MSSKARSASRYLPSLTGRAFADLWVYSAAVGAAIGLGFPWLLVILGLDPELAFSTNVRLCCVGAGLGLAAVNVSLAVAVVRSRVAGLSRAMDATTTALAASIEDGAGDLCPDGDCHVLAGSADELGRVASSYNALVDAVVQAHAVQRSVAEVTAALSTRADRETLCQTALELLRTRTAIRAAAIAVATDEGRRVACVGPIASDAPLGALVDDVLDAAAQGPRASLSRGGWWAAPLRAEGATLGALLVPEQAVLASPGDRHVVSVLASGLGIALANARAQRRLEQAASTDELTGLANRRTGLRLLADRLRQPGATVGIAMVDVDHFKDINDTFGHLVGDRLLTQLANACRDAVRAGDLVMRYGGEEFAVIFTGVGSADLANAAERIRATVARAGLHLEDGTRVPVSVSVGAALADAHTGSDRDPVTALLARADAALYAAKNAGRDRYVIALPGGAS